MSARAAVVVLSLLLSSAMVTASEVPANVTILCYHIVESPRGEVFTVPRETFEKQMEYLATSGYHVISMATLHDHLSGKLASLPPNSVVVTVDDGWRCTYTEMFPVMKKHRFPFTVFVYPKFVDKGPYAVTWAQLKEMAEHGAEIQSHSFSHPMLTRRKHSSYGRERYEKFLHVELRESKEVIEKEVGREVSFLAYPYGDYDTHVATVAADVGYKAAVTCDFGMNSRGIDPLRLKRAVVYANTSMDDFRGLLRAGGLSLEKKMPKAGEIFDSKRPVISARIADFEKYDPSSIGMSILGYGLAPYSFDSRDGSISMVPRRDLSGNKQQVVVWGNHKETGKRFESSWTFLLRKLPPEKRPEKPPAPAAPGEGIARVKKPVKALPARVSAGKETAVPASAPQK